VYPARECRAWRRRCPEARDRVSVEIIQNWDRLRIHPAAAVIRAFSLDLEVSVQKNPLLTIRNEKGHRRLGYGTPVRITNRLGRTSKFATLPRRLG